MTLNQYYRLSTIAFILGGLFSAKAQQIPYSLGNAFENTEQIKSAINQGIQDSSAIKQLILDAELAMTLDTFSVVNNSPVPPSGNKNDYYSWAPYWWPNPDTADGLPYISKDGKTNPETESKSDKPFLRRMAMAVQTLALAHYYTHDSRYAFKAAALIRGWFLDPATRMNPNLNYAQCVPGVEEGRSSGIIDTRWFIIVIDAIQLLHHANALTSGDMHDLKLWFADYLGWLLTSKIGQEEAESENNHGSWYAAQTARFALFVDNESLTRQIINDSKRFFESQLDTVGRQIHELHRTKSFDYSLYNIHALITLATIAEQVHMDLWHYHMDHKKNLQRAIQYMATSYYSGEKWPYPQISDRAISLDYEDGLHFSVYYPYDLYTALRTGYKIYQDSLFLICMHKIPMDQAKAHRSNLLIYLEGF